MPFGTMMIEGKVKFFNNRKEKRFGFFYSEKCGDVFFHFSDGRAFVIIENDKPFIGLEKSNKEPRKGDRVVFNISKVRGRFKASIWGFAENYERVKQELESRCP